MWFTSILTDLAAILRCRDLKARLAAVVKLCETYRDNQWGEGVPEEIIALARGEGGEQAGSDASGVSLNSPDKHSELGTGQPAAPDAAQITMHAYEADSPLPEPAGPKSGRACKHCGYGPEHPRHGNASRNVPETVEPAAPDATLDEIVDEAAAKGWGITNPMHLSPIARDALRNACIRARETERERWDKEHDWILSLNKSLSERHRVLATQLAAVREWRNKEYEHGEGVSDEWSKGYYTAIGLIKRDLDAILDYDGLDEDEIPTRPPDTLYLSEVWRSDQGLFFVCVPNNQPRVKRMAKYRKERD
jgi:hypothetical protein